MDLSMALRADRAVPSVEDVLRHYTAIEHLDGADKYACQKCVLTL